MSRFYALTALVIALCWGAPAAFAQRHVNIQVTMISPVDNQTVTVGIPFNFRVELKNLGPDSLKASDSVYLYCTGAGSNYYSWSKKVKAPGDTILLNDMLTVSSASSTTIRFCAYGFLSSFAAVDTNAANDSSCIARLNIKSSTGTGIGVIFSPGGGQVTRTLNLFPNPSGGHVDLDYTSVSNVPLTAYVVDLAGRVIMSHDFGATYPGGKGFSLDLSVLQPGVYFVELRQGPVRSIGRLNKL